MYFNRVCLVIFHIGNNIHFILYHDGWSVGRLCIIFRNCPDIKDSVNSPIVALTNLSFSRVRSAFFNALKASTGSGKRILKSFNLVICQLKLIRKSSIDVSGCLDFFQKYRRPKRQTGLCVSSFSYTFSIPSSELRAIISNSKTASLAFLSRKRNTIRARFNFLTHMAISQICISFFHVLYLSVS